jgi:hypothetical protein
MARHLVLRSAICVWLLVAGFTSTDASPTALNVIPIVETVPAGNILLGVATATVRSSIVKTNLNLFETEYGIGDRCEIGVDPVFGEGGGALINGKYRFFDESRFRPAAAIGVQNAGPRFSNQPFIALCKTFQPARLHFGAIGDQGTMRAMFGIEKTYGKSFTLQADYMSGSGNWFSIGFVAGGATGWSLNVAQLIGNSESSGNGYLIDLQWGGKLRL